MTGEEGRRTSVRQAVLDGLLAERYAPSVWWTRPGGEDGGPDTETTTARRRRQMAADYARIDAS